MFKTLTMIDDSVSLPWTIRDIWTPAVRHAVRAVCSSPQLMPQRRQETCFACVTEIAFAVFGIEAHRGGWTSVCYTRPWATQPTAQPALSSIPCPAAAARGKGTVQPWDAARNRRVHRGASSGANVSMSRGSPRVALASLSRGRVAPRGPSGKEGTGRLAVLVQRRDRGKVPSPPVLG